MMDGNHDIRNDIDAILKMPPCDDFSAGTIKLPQALGYRSNRDGVVSGQSERPRDANDFELITWLVIREDKAKAGASAK